MDSARESENRQMRKGGPNPGLLRPPIIFLSAILLGIALNRAWPIHFLPANLGWLGPLVTLCAALLFLLSYREFRAAGTSVRGSERSTTIVRTGPYRFSRNPIYLSLILLVVGLSIWFNDLWLIVTLIPAIAVIAAIVIPREERFLERNFPVQYSSYKAIVRVGCDSASVAGSLHTQEVTRVLVVPSFFSPQSCYIPLHFRHKPEKCFVDTKSSAEKGQNTGRRNLDEEISFDGYGSGCSCRCVPRHY